MSAKRPRTSLGQKEQGAVPSAAASKKKAREEATADSPINSVPVDILTLIFTLFPLRPRLRAVSLVCKRWRTASLRSITALCFGHAHKQQLPVDMARCIFSHLPALSDVQLRHFAKAKRAHCRDVLQFPHTLTHLSMLLLSDPLYRPEFASPFPRLQDLHVDLAARAPLDEVLQPCISSLTSLHLTHFKRIASDELPFDLLATVRLPLLSRFTVNFFSDEPDRWAPLLEFLRAHAIQLTSIKLGSTMNCWEDYHALASISFPQLLSLYLDFYQIPALSLAKIINNAPKLESLSVKATSSWRDVSLPLLSSLTALVDFPYRYSDEDYSILLRLPKLHRFSDIDPLRCPHQLLSCLSSALQLREAPPEHLWHAISRMTGLEALCLPKKCPFAALPNVKFPRLTFLILSLARFDLDTVLAHCRYFFRTCPSLRFCQLELPCRDSFPGLEDLLSEAVQHVPTLRTMEIEYKYPSGSPDPLAALRRGEFLWLKVTFRGCIRKAKGGYT